jgi:hypothetical protein
VAYVVPTRVDNPTELHDTGHTTSGCLHSMEALTCMHGKESLTCMHSGIHSKESLTCMHSMQSLTACI